MGEERSILRIWEGGLLGRILSMFVRLVMSANMSIDEGGP